MTEEAMSQPMLSIWFGNFFEPFYSDREAVRRGIAEVKDLGFNSINLDSKAREDFFARYRGEESSQYVAMQEFMMKEAASHGMDYTMLALYLCGDNLYRSPWGMQRCWRRRSSECRRWNRGLTRFGCSCEIKNRTTVYEDRCVGQCDLKNAFPSPLREQRPDFEQTR